MSYYPCNIIVRRNSILSGEFKRLQNAQKTQYFSTIPCHRTILPLCASAKSLQQTKQCHAIALLNGYLPNSISVSASLILQYATFGDPSTSRVLFHQSLPYSRSAFLWNTITRAYSIAGVYDAFQIYNLMIRNGVRPDDHSFPFVLKVCSDYHEVWKGQEVHGLVCKLGFDSDVFVGNTLLRFYGECSSINDAEKVFDEMPERDAVSWNTLIAVFSIKFSYDKAIALFRDMRSQPLYSGVSPNVATIVSLLPVCASIEDFAITSEIHSYVIKMGFSDDIKINNAFIDAYGKCGNLNACKQVFNEMVDRNHVSFNAIITSFAHTDHHQDAILFFQYMINKSITPNSVAISSILPIIVELECLQWGIELHGFSIRTGIESDIFVANSLLDMYAKFRYPIKASNIFNNIHLKNIVSWNTMIANYAQNGSELLALQTLREMQAHGIVPGPVTLTNILPACARISHLSHGKQIHCKSIRCGFDVQIFISNALIDMYAKCSRLDLARNVFNVSYKDRISYNTLISAYSHTNTSFESLILFRELGLKDMEYDTVSFSGALSACANMAEIKKGKEIHGVCLKKGYTPLMGPTHQPVPNLMSSDSSVIDSHLLTVKQLHSLIVCNSILDFYAKCGRIDLAKKVFDRIPNKDTASWNTMIMGYGMRGEIDTAIGLFESMGDDDHVRRDSINYIAVLSVCSHGGLVELGRKYFKKMKEDKIEVTQVHYACMVDIFGRAGLLEEAVEMINGMGVEPDANVWGSLLGGCRIHGDIELGRWAGENLFRLKPGHSGYYTLVSNMYAEAGKWCEVDGIRELMKVRGVKKNPGSRSL
uniref:Pentacotripeptide-repeat region of PRORP domain-containing protein n=1 Tax=Lactuca sativa TaxID=4236 RepID=A0A9R1W069_LACSA|nr:hypothetical protein LSAT_V11C300148700 [Lactuca sativa]